MKNNYEVLFTPFNIGKLEIKNRFVMVPMAPTAIIDWVEKPEGFTGRTRELILNRAKDGVGLIIPGGTGNIFCRRPYIPC